MMGWRWWLRIGVNETPRMRPSWWALRAERARLLEAFDRMVVDLGVMLIPMFESMMASWRATIPHLVALAEQLQ